MSINEQLIDDMEALMISEPNSLIKVINDIPFGMLMDNFNKFKIALKRKMGDINLIEFSQINGYTEHIMNNDLNIGEIILIGFQETEDDYLNEIDYLEDCGRCYVSIIKVEEKVSNNSYKCQELSSTGLSRTKSSYYGVYDPKVIDNIHIRESFSCRYFIEFKDNGWEYYRGSQYPEDQKFKCFRKKN